MRKGRGERERRRDREPRGGERTETKLDLVYTNQRTHVYYVQICRKLREGRLYYNSGVGQCNQAVRTTKLSFISETLQRDPPNKGHLPIRNIWY